MTYQRWNTIDHHDELGVLVHGPAIVARSPGIAFAVRTVFAHGDGLIIDVILRASGVQGQAAVRQTFGATPHLRRDPSEGSQPVVFVEAEGQRMDVYGYGASDAEGGDETFSSHSTLSVSLLPGDHRITLTAAWPQAGLSEGTVTLLLDIPGDLEERVLHLL